ncbi:hypothetical protein P280DRAFT_517144 [Massarina eburnea CBS 473.64]|uniref:Uncharacterized protein n=1 Tax=Massarina eburnea CBS 473.64 TaxID=1395130 RepID=A0A6A6S4D6_9PLEO|nr:hypothetical protein P280DRAFT_517144 [Massarina eburnea CBS 473.64]
MPPAATRALYPNLRPNPTTAPEIVKSYKSLHPSELTQLIQILHAPPFPSTPTQDRTYTDKTPRLIAALPQPLKSSSTIANMPTREYLTKFSDPTTGRLDKHYLCPLLHKGLERRLIRSIWSFVRFELERGIGRFIFPVIVSDGVISGEQEDAARQLEPVLRMFHAEFTVEGATPVGKVPVHPGVEREGGWVPKWKFQDDGCMACMLARIGEDKAVLTALLAGMVARWGKRFVGSREVVRSRRVRFVKAWLEGRCGWLVRKRCVDRAWGLGVVLRAAAKEIRKAGGAGGGGESGESVSRMLSGPVDGVRGGDGGYRPHSPTTHHHGDTRHSIRTSPIRTSTVYPTTTPPTPPTNRPASHIPRNPYIYTPHPPQAPSPPSHSLYADPPYPTSPPPIHNVASSHPTLVVPTTPSRYRASITPTLSSVASPERYSQLSWNRMQGYGGGRGVSVYGGFGGDGEGERDEDDTSSGSDGEWDEDDDEF